MRSASAGVAIICTIAACSLSTISGGVPLGRKKPVQVMASKSLSPCSCAVASVGMSDERSRARSAMPLTVPLSICGSAPALLEHM